MMPDIEMHARTVHEGLTYKADFDGSGVDIDCKEQDGPTHSVRLPLVIIEWLFSHTAAYRRAIVAAAAE